MNTDLLTTFSLVSLDVISLFTNVPLDLTIKCLNRRWNFIKRNTIILKDEFMDAVSFILKSIFFKFNYRIYKQTFGTPMDSPLSSIIADIVLQDLEKETLNSLDFSLPFYYRYMDNIILAVLINFQKTLSH